MLKTGVIDLGMMGQPHVKVYKEIGFDVCGGRGINAYLPRGYFGFASI